MKLVLILIAFAIVFVAVVAAISIVVWRAVGALFDWLIVTFGNESARNELLRGRERRDGF